MGKVQKHENKFKTDSMTQILNSFRKEKNIYLYIYLQVRHKTKTQQQIPTHYSEKNIFKYTVFWKFSLSKLYSITLNKIKLRQVLLFWGQSAFRSMMDLDHSATITRKSP